MIYYVKVKKIIYFQTLVNKSYPFLLGALQFMQATYLDCNLNGLTQQ